MDTDDTDDGAEIGADKLKLSADQDAAGGDEADDAAAWEALKAKMASGEHRKRDKPAKAGGKKPAAKKDAEDDQDGDVSDRDGDEDDAGDEKVDDEEKPAAKPKAKKDEKADDDKADDAEDEDDKDKVELDAAGKKRLEAQQRQERRHKEQVEKDRKALEAEAAKVQKVIDEWAPKVERVAKLEKQFRSRPMVLVELLEGMGATPEDFDVLGRVVYARGSGAAKDPKWKTHAEKLSREREDRGEVAELHRKLEALERRDQEREQRAKYEQNERAYLDKTVETVKAADAPLSKLMLGKSPEKLRAGLRAAAVELSKLDPDRAPDHEDVVALFEKNRREQLEETGVDVDALLAAAKKGGKGKDDGKPEGKPKGAARTLGNAGAGAPKDDDEDDEKKPKSEAEEWEEFKRKRAEERRRRG